MSILNVSKVLASLPNTLSPNTVYYVRVGEGFDTYVTDDTGQIAHTLNSLSPSDVQRYYTSDPVGGSFTQHTGIIAKWVRTLVFSEGQLTVPVTTNGNLGGQRIFANLSECDIKYSVLRDTDDNEESPWAHLRQIGDDFFSLQIKKSNQGGVLLGGAYYGNLNNTNEVYVNVSVTGILHPDLV